MTRSGFDDLVAIMARLLGEDGCPWDRQQTLESLRRYLIEETYEVLQAIDEEDPAHHCDELGDLLFQVVFQAALAERAGRFTIGDVVRAIAEKLVRRHPHVFAGAVVDGPAEVRDRWHQIKEAERAREGGPRRTLDGVPRHLPALLRAQRLQEKASHVGFDWPTAAGARDKVAEELAELDAAVPLGEADAVRHEVGDLLLAVVNLARKLGVDAETALGAAADRFVERFAAVEDRLQETTGRRPAEATLAELDALWDEAKRTLPKK